MSRISRSRYASLYGPTTGDRVRLADTNLVARIEHDYAVYGERPSSAAASRSATAWRSRRGRPRPPARRTP